MNLKTLIIAPLLFLSLPLLALEPDPPTLAPDPPTPGSVVDLALAMMQAALAAHDAEDGTPDNPTPDEPGSSNAASPEYNPADALATDCFNNDGCFECMGPAIDLADRSYTVLAENHAWKKWTATQYKRMDGLATAASGLNKYGKTAYALQKSRVILPAKKAFEDNVKTAQTKTLNSLRSAFEKIGRCEVEFLGEDNFTNIALLGWQIMKVKYLD